MTIQTAQCIGKRIRWRKKEVNAGDKRRISVDESQLPLEWEKFIHTSFLLALQKVCWTTRGSRHKPTVVSPDRYTEPSARLKC